MIKDILSILLEIELLLSLMIGILNINMIL
jgi:hypothetical protein